MVSLEKYEIYEAMESNPVAEYLGGKNIIALRMKKISSVLYAVYLVEMAGEEASFIMLSIPGISIKKVEVEINI